MDDEFPIVVAIKPDPAGVAKVDSDLAGIEKHAKATGEVIAKAIADGFDRMAQAAAKAKREADETARAAAAARETREQAAAMKDFERDAALAFRQVKSSIKDSAKAVDDFGKDALGALRAVAKETKDASGWKAYKASAMGVVDVVGKIGLAISTVERGIQFATMAMDGLANAGKIAASVMGHVNAERFRAFQGGGGVIGGIVGSKDDEAPSWTEDVAWRDSGGSLAGMAADQLRAAAIDTLRSEGARVVGEFATEIGALADAAARREELARVAQQNIFDRNLAKREDDQAQHRAAIRKKREKAEAWAKANPVDRSAFFDAFNIGDDLENLSDNYLSPVADGYRQIAESARWAAEEAEAFNQASDAADIAREREWARLGDVLGELENERGPRRSAAGFAVGKDGHPAGIDWRKATTDAEKFAAALEGPVGGAIDGLIDGLATWEMNWKDWGRSALAEISKVMARLLLLQLVESAFGAGGGTGALGRGLVGALGGAPNRPGGSSRQAPGDPFGNRAGGGSGAVFREPVAQRQAPQGGQQGGGGGAPIIRVVVPFDAHGTTLAMLKTSEAEQVVLGVIQRHAGKLGLR